MLQELELQADRAVMAEGARQGPDRRAADMRGDARMSGLDGGAGDGGGSWPASLRDVGPDGKATGEPPSAPLYEAALRNRMTAIRPRRSVLYMPASNARALEKARTLPADALIIDLEDAVAPDAKEAAREQVVAALRQGGYGTANSSSASMRLIRPGAKATSSRRRRPAPDAMLVPKVSAAETLTSVGIGFAASAPRTAPGSGP